MKQTCRICKHELEELAGFEKLARVTSDCRPHPAGGNLGICLACATVQKPETPFYVDELGSIYSDYDIYYQGGGKEQLIFDQSTGQSVPRSTRVVELLHKKTDLPEKGRLLDIGCGGGHFLKSFATRMPHWEIFGYERDREAMARACSLVPEATIMHGNLSRIKGLFDIVSINHTFEHVPAPAMLLKDIRDRLAPSGLLLINVPDFEDNPFDLIIADHCTHFTRASLTRLLAGQGFSCLGDMTGISKELLAVARKCAPSGKTRIPDIAGAVKNVEASLTWLGSMAEKAARTSPQGRALFGTSIAAIWLFNMLEGAVDLFVDEDPARTGKEFLGRPVVAPSEMPEGGIIILPFPTPTSKAIRDRLARLPVTFVLPDDLPEPAGRKE